MYIAASEVFCIRESCVLLEFMASVSTMILTARGRDERRTRRTERPSEARKRRGDLVCNSCLIKVLYVQRAF